MSGNAAMMAVLCRRERVRVWSVWRINGFLQEIRKIAIQISFGRPSLREDIGRNVPAVIERQLGVQVVRSMRHVEVHEVCKIYEACHSGAVIEAVVAPKRGRQIAKRWITSASLNTGSIRVVASRAGAGINHFAARGIGSSREFGHLTSSHSF